MKNLSTIFNHPKKSNPEKDPHLYDWKRPFHGKDDAACLNKLLKTRHHRGTINRLSSAKASPYGNPNNLKQRVMFKMSYGNSLEKHKKYIKLQQQRNYTINNYINTTYHIRIYLYSS